MTAAHAPHTSLRKHKIVGIKCNTKKKEFVVEKKGGKVVTVEYNEQGLKSSKFGCTQFKSPSLSAVKEKKNQCVLASFITSIIMLLSGDDRISEIVNKLKDHLLSDDNMNRRCKEYKKENPLKVPGVEGSPNRGWYQYDLRNLIVSDINMILGQFGYSVSLSKNLSRTFCKNSKFLVKHKDRCNKAYILMGHHVGRAAREKHRHISDQLGLGNFAENVRCNFEAVCTDGTRGSKHGVAILFDDAGNGAMADPDPLKKEYKTLTLDTYIDSCINIFACFEIFVHKMCPR